MKLFKLLVTGLQILTTQILTTQISAKPNILFIGNSFTIRNNMPKTFSRIAGGKAKVTSVTGGSMSWNSHSKSSLTRDVINMEEWDYIVLQEQSQFLSYHASQYYRSSIQYLKSLESQMSPNTTIVLFETWGYRYGNPSLGTGIYDTYYKMQDRLLNGYIDSFNELTNPKLIAYVGEACKKRFPIYEKKLYATDGKHPSKHLSYMSACQIYRVIFNIDGKIIPKYRNGISRRLVKKWCN